MAHAICFLCTYFLFVCHFRYFCSGRDTIRIGDWIYDSYEDNKIVSAGNIFQLGFFTPRGIISGRYVGIQYCNSPEVIVWVANREVPIPLNGSGSFGIDIESGNLEVSGNTTTYFSTNLTNSPESQAFLRTAKLYDTGNLVLIDDRTSSIVWESFRDSTDTFLPGMKMDENLNLTSWKSDKDPALGSYSFRPDGVYSDYGSKLYWKSGGEPANSFIPKQRSTITDVVLYLSGTTRTTGKKISYNRSSSVFDSHSRLVMQSDGKIRLFRWDSTNKTWSVVSSEPQGRCSVFNACGSFGKCKPDSHDFCTCFQGYEPANEKDWKSGEFSGGCKKKSSKCNPRDNTTSFELLLVTMLRSNTPIFINSTNSTSTEDDCESVCRSNCTCQAFSYTSNSTNFGSNRGSSGCWFWYDNLINIQEGSTDGEHNIRVRIDPPSNIDLGLNPLLMGIRQRKITPSTRRVVVIATSIIFAVALLCSITCISYRRVVAKGKENQDPRLYGNECLMDQDDQFGEDDKKDIDVPFFELESILAATDNFSQAHKLGQGGFGPVYKGKFPGGEEIAVKRLSSNSRQGLMEFKNEVVLIAKLQHRNLVRLWGYCIKGNERILLYEYMPNKSLDAFVFDEKLRMLLNWAIRFDIIVGVARGLLYLHQDSRLRIIHRDMKASNILLDEEMNPKIFDFGLARIVGRKETESNTTRVMGTYGYMAPEYALEGQFSVKSDAFSFGVVVLEIISGKKITGFFDSQLGLTLLGHVWNLWKAEKPMTLLDETLMGSCNDSEVLKCITVGLLCVQEDPNDRPDMSKVVIMLSSETETLPKPKQPAFVTRKRFFGTTSSSSTKPETLSKSEITFSEEDGR